MLSQAGVNFSRAVQTADALVAEISFLEFIQEKQKMYGFSPSFGPAWGWY